MPLPPPTPLGRSGTWYHPPWDVADFYYGVWGDDTCRLWAVGQVWGGRKGIVCSSDYGRSWSPQDRPNRHDLWAIHGHCEGHVWAVGSSGTVLRAEPVTGAWKRVRTGLEIPLHTVWCNSASEVYVGSMNGAIFRTLDTGKTWKQVNETARVRAISGRPGEALFAVGGSHLPDFPPLTILRSEDGERWEPVGASIPPSPTHGVRTYDSVALSQDGKVFVGREDGVLFRSADGGSTWEPVLLPEAPASPISSVTTNNSGLVLACSFHIILSSKDGGTTWQQEYLTPDRNRHAWHHALWLGSHGDAVAVGAHGTILVRQR